MLKKAQVYRGQLAQIVSRSNLILILLSTTHKVPSFDFKSSL